MFYRKSDVIVLQARTVELVDRGYEDVLVRLLAGRLLEIGEEKINPDDVPHLEAVSAEIVLPREAMGLGDVKFMGGDRRVHRLAGRGIFADDQRDDRRGGGLCAAHRLAAAANGRRGCPTALTSRWRRRFGFLAARKSSTQFSPCNACLLP